jgi:hypothetical protein
LDEGSTRFLAKSAARHFRHHGPSHSTMFWAIGNFLEARLQHCSVEGIVPRFRTRTKQYHLTPLRWCVAEPTHTRLMVSRHLAASHIQTSLEFYWASESCHRSTVRDADEIRYWNTTRSVKGNRSKPNVAVVLEKSPSSWALYNVATGNSFASLGICSIDSWRHQIINAGQWFIPLEAASLAAS